TIREAYDINRTVPGAFQRVYERECRRLRPDETRDICADEIRRKTRELVLTVPMIAQTKLRTLQTLLGAFGRVDGPKVVVLLSQGIPYGDFLPPEIPDIGRLAARAAISFYAIQMFQSTSEVTESAQALDLDADRRMMADSLANIASASGGALLQPTGRVDA